MAKKMKCDICGQPAVKTLYDPDTGKPAFGYCEEHIPENMEEFCRKDDRDEECCA